MARLFTVGLATVDRYVRRKRDSGDLRPKAHPGATPLIPPAQYPALIAQLEETPDATLAEHCVTWERTQGVRVSIEAMRQTIARVGWPLKKRRLRRASKIPSHGPRG